MSKLKINDMIEKLNMEELSDDGNEQQPSETEEEYEELPKNPPKLVRQNATQHEEKEESEEEESEEDEESEVELEVKKPKKIKSKLQLKNYKKNKKLLSNTSKIISKLLRDFKLDIRKYLKSYNGMELYDDDIDDIIEEHNLVKRDVLENLFNLEQELQQEGVELPQNIYNKIDKCFDETKKRVEKFLG